MTRWIKSSIALLYSVMMICILGLITINIDQITFAYKRDFLFEQETMLLCGITCLSILAFMSLSRRAANRAYEKSTLKRIPFWIILFSIQLILCFHTYFLSGWDSGTILDAAYYSARGEVYDNAGYFSMYPNNIPLLVLFTAIIRVIRFIFGDPGLDRCVYVIIAGQCLLNTFTGMLCSKMIRKETGSDCAACFTALVYAAFVGLSPWLMIPYSDSMALVFPVLILLIYQCFKNRSWAWILIGATSALGYLIKPQVVIVFVAILIVECIRMIECRMPILWIKKAVGAVVILALVAFSGFHMLKKALPMEYDPNTNMGALHFVMMGLNNETNGVYSYKDVTFSSIHRSLNERREAQMQEIKRRLSMMSSAEMIDHLKKKTLTNYADGSFAWGCEGEFFKHWIADKDEYLSPFLKTVVDTRNPRYLMLQTYFQSIWLSLLMGGVICCLLNRGGMSEHFYALMLSIIGLSLFELIFEARARYLYIYAPFYVMLGGTGIWLAMERLLGKK